jgi:hypothetical protein
MDATMGDVEATEQQVNNHVLSDKWVLWAHLPHDTDWSLKSYIRIHTVNTVEDAIALVESLPDALVRNCMLFMMRDGVHPTWEDPRNREGGCFSYKVNNKQVPSAWRGLSLCIVGETAANEAKISAEVTGITISPKKQFCIIKIWMSSCKYQNPDSFKNIRGLTSQGCLFKKQTPEY